MMKTSRIAVVLALFAFSLGASASTKVLNSEKSPAATGPLQFKKVLALVVSQDVQARKTAEDELVKQMKAREGVIASTLLTSEELKDKEKAKAKIQASGCDGIVVMRLLDRRRENASAWTISTNVIVYSSFWGFYDALYAGPISYSAGYTNTDLYIVLETRVYSLKDDALLWTGVTQTKNPDSLREMIEEVAKKVGGQLRKDGLLK
jgi:hypothetical protein